MDSQRRKPVSNWLNLPTYRPLYIHPRNLNLESMLLRTIMDKKARKVISANSIALIFLLFCWAFLREKRAENKQSGLDDECRQRQKRASFSSYSRGTTGICSFFPPDKWSWNDVKIAVRYLPKKDQAIMYIEEMGRRIEGDSFVTQKISTL